MTRNRKGTVAIKDRNGNITLLWTYGGKRHWLALGLPLNPINLGIAETIKRRIEADFITNAFDPTLEKYKLPHQKAQLPKPKKSLDFIEEFLKKPRSNKRTWDVYRSAIANFREFFGDRKLEISKAESTEFLEWLRLKVSPATLKAYFVRLSAIWDWAAEEELTTTANPWKRHISKIKVPSPRPQPFTKEEIQKILNALSYNAYKPFVEFLFRTGCRIGEAIELKWSDVSEDLTTVTINATKTDTVRVIKLSPLTTQILKRIRRRSDYVFTAPYGGKIIAQNFRDKVWKPTLENLEIPHRSPHTMRVTLVTHSLESGANPVLLSRATGHSTQVMLKHYLGNTGTPNVIPEIF